MIVAQGALVWPVIDQADYASISASPAQVAQAKAMAVEWLWALTGRQLGTRTCLDRPSTYVSRDFNRWPLFLTSVFGGGQWPFDYDPRTGAKAEQFVVELERDAVSVSQVDLYDANQVHTQLLAADNPCAFRLEGNYLVRQDGTPWPLAQNMVLGMGAANTWSVAYTRGRVPTEWGQAAAGMLAWQFALALVGDKQCKLPANVTTATRNGVTVVRDITKAMVTTGVAAVDQYVASLNPNGLQSPGSVWSPDIKRNQPPYRGSFLMGGV